jgi:pimeloyl-ACP methyl ester carboxylesterase
VLEAAAAGLPISKLALYEPPFRPGETDAKSALVTKLAELISAGRAGDAVATFQIEGIGTPADMVDQMRNSPLWPSLEAIAQTVVYDATICVDPGPSEAVRAIEQPIAVLAGTETFPNLIAAAHYAADMITNATFVEVPGGPFHQLDATTTAVALREFLG